MKRYFLSVVASCIVGGAVSYAEPIVLKSPALKLIDGTVFMSGEVTVPFMLHVRRILKDILFGVEKNGQREGMFVYNGARYSLRDLTNLENQIKHDLYQQEETFLQRNVGRHTQEWQDAERWSDEQLASLHVVLNEAKKIVDEALNPFIDQASGAKGPMLALIKESCEKRKREESFLLNWGRAKEGEETVIFYEEIKTFDALDAFCTDLNDFLTDLINSCPIAQKQFKLFTKKKIMHKLALELLEELINEDSEIAFLDQKMCDKAIQEIVALIDTDSKIISASEIKTQERAHIKSLLKDSLLR